jgi:hypothetical protein
VRREKLRRAGAREEATHHTTTAAGIITCGMMARPHRAGDPLAEAKGASIGPHQRSYKDDSEGNGSRPFVCSVRRWRLCGACLETLLAGFAATHPTIKSTSLRR